MLIRDYAKMSARKNGRAPADRLDGIAKTMEGGAKACRAAVVVEVVVEK